MYVHMYIELYPNRLNSGQNKNTVKHNEKWKHHREIYEYYKSKMTDTILAGLVLAESIL